MLSTLSLSGKGSARQCLRMNSRIETARRLRRTSTDAERRLWYFLRNRQLGGFRFRRQLPIGRYFADFACIEARLAIELDGGQHLDDGVADAERAQRIARAGFRVLRVWNTQALLETESVLKCVLAALREAHFDCAPDANDRSPRDQQRENVRRPALDGARRLRGKRCARVSRGSQAACAPCAAGTRP